MQEKTERVSVPQVEALPSAENPIVFGPFKLYVKEHALLHDDKPLELGSRALDVLITLVSASGQVVEKEALLSRVWPGVHVDDSNLRAQVAGVRRAMKRAAPEHSYVATVPGRGYRFSFPVRDTGGTGEYSSGRPPIATLPVRLTPIYGREEMIVSIIQQLSSHRFVAITGPGGIGKTTVAIAAARKVGKKYKNGVGFADFSSAAGPSLVPTILGAALGTSTALHDPIPGITAYLRDKRMLLVMDGCEHVAGEAAKLIELILKSAPHVAVLATTREALRAEGEYVFPLPPLDTPPESNGITATEVQSFSSVQLFLERAVASHAGFKLRNEDASLVAEICRKLDGIALAIELAATRVDAFGIRGIAALLDDRFRLLSLGRRTARARQQTLRDTFDWSHALLTGFEQALLRRLSVFPASFSLAGATAVSAVSPIDPNDVPRLLANLVAKSLVAVVEDSDPHRYRLLDTTRAYAQEKLSENGEVSETAARHCDYLCRLFETSDANYRNQPAREWIQIYGREIDSLRFALDWAWSAEGNSESALKLTVAGVPLWFRLALLDECRTRIDQALAALDSSGDDRPRLSMPLLAARASLFMNRYGNGPEMKATWTKVLNAAEMLGDTEHEVRALWGLWVESRNSSKHKNALKFARRFQRLAKREADPSNLVVGNRMMGISLFYAGQLDEALQHVDQALADRNSQTRGSQIIDFQFDQQIAARCFRAQILLSQGAADQAIREAKANVLEAIASAHAPTLAYALSQGACPVALLSGDLDSAECFTRSLLKCSEQGGLYVWNLIAKSFYAIVRARRRLNSAKVASLMALLPELQKTGPGPTYALIVASLAELQIDSGQPSDALVTIDELLSRCKTNGEYWFMEEVERIKARALSILRTSPKDSSGGAIVLLKSALERAKRRGALFFELRAAIILARLLRDEGRSKEAARTLGSTYSRLKEGFHTADAREARRIIAHLSK